jgi:hypothetical protein
LIDLDQLGAAVESSGFGLWAAQSSLAYPVANSIHLLGLVMLVGAIGFLDLRLAGLFRAIPVVPLSRALTPIAITGLILIVPSGATMFAADAQALLTSSTFQWKMALVLLALINALAFRYLWSERMARWDEKPSLAGRLMALASIGLWLCVAGLGRWIAYS